MVIVWCKYKIMHFLYLHYTYIILTLYLHPIGNPTLTIIRLQHPGLAPGMSLPVFNCVSQSFP
jgi:hypothetical protein